MLYCTSDMPEHSGHGILSCPHERRNYHWLAIGWLITSLDITLDTTHTSHEIHMVVVSNSLLSCRTTCHHESLHFTPKIALFQFSEPTGDKLSYMTRGSIILGVARYLCRGEKALKSGFRVIFCLFITVL